MCVVLASEEDICPYWIQEVVITHPLEKDRGNDLGYAEVFLTIALVSGVEKSKLVVFHKGAIEDLKDESEAFQDQGHWWWELTKRFPGRSAKWAPEGAVLHHSLPEKEQRWEELLHRYLNVKHVSQVTWERLAIRRPKGKEEASLPGLTTVWPHDALFEDAEKLIKKSYKEIPVVRIEIGEIPSGSWLLQFSFVTTAGIFPMGPSDIIFRLLGPSKVINTVCKDINSTQDHDALALMRSMWPGLRLAQWVSHAQYDIAGLAPEEFELTEARAMFPEKSRLLGLVDINPTRSNYQRFAAYGFFPESGDLEAALRVSPRCYIEKK